MQTVHTLADLRSELAALRLQGKRIALVPTMGALHEGHLSLLEVARAHADAVVASIFVNPTQFGPSEDFSRYPRTLEQDSAMLAQAGCQLLYAPDVADMYPEGFSTSIHVAGITGVMCGPHRPGHFDGVATVVAKLLWRALPDVAVFGEKDYQQLMVIKRLVVDMDIPVRIVGAPTLREADGLAMSSRNRYLSPKERAVAPQLHAVLRRAGEQLEQGGKVTAVLQETRQEILVAGFTRLDYVELCDAANLQPLIALIHNARLAAAAWIGTTRLIDNIAVGARHAA